MSCCLPRIQTRRHETASSRKSPKNPELQDKPIHTTTHAGQEFDLIIKGSLKIKVGDHEEILHEGDSIFYKSSTPHGMIAVGGQDCVFLSMIMASDTTDQPMFIANPGKSDPGSKLLCEKFIHAA